MQPFRKNIAIAIDGGGIRGIIVAKALSMLEDALGVTSHDIFRLCAGTSTGSILSAGIALGLTGAELFDLYRNLGDKVIRKTWRSLLWPLTRYRYALEPLREVLHKYVRDRTMGELWEEDPKTDLVVTAFDLVENRTCFIKPWKANYAQWPIVKAVLASCCVPTYFPVVEGRYVDGGVGSYANPCYLAAYELRFCLEWDPRETTLISLGTGRSPGGLAPGEANRLLTTQWITPLLGAFMQSADDQQVHLVNTFFKTVDFRRFQVDMRQNIEMDDISAIPQLEVYGEILGSKILNDEVDKVLNMTALRAPGQGMDD
ncbi:MAG: patatin-like phospholipase family protein [Anaerolineae bacterium]|nr:patatin-like phospholipase family protein [Anaerolineae bacterium]